MRSVTASVHHPFRNALMVEMEDFLAKVEVFEDRGPPWADLQGILIIKNWTTLGCREHWSATLSNLV